MDIETATGWLASLVLFGTVGSQVWKQIREKRSEGVSRGLFLGQILASSLFLAYAVMGGDVVFIVSNAFMVATAVIGQIALWRNRRRATHEPGTGP